MIGALQLLELPLAEVGSPLGLGAVLDQLADRLDECRAREFTQLSQLRLGIDPLGQHGGDEPALRRGVRLAWDHVPDYARLRAESRHREHLPRPPRHRGVPVREARAGEATACGRWGRARRLRQGRSDGGDGRGDPPGSRRRARGAHGLPARRGTPGAARGDRRLVRAAVRGRPRSGHGDRADVRVEGGDLPARPGPRRP